MKSFNTSKKIHWLAILAVIAASGHMAFGHAPSAPNPCWQPETALPIQFCLSEHLREKIGTASHLVTMVGHFSDGIPASGLTPPLQSYATQYYHPGESPYREAHVAYVSVGAEVYVFGIARGFKVTTYIEGIAEHGLFGQSARIALGEDANVRFLISAAPKASHPSLLANSPSGNEAKQVYEQKWPAKAFKYLFPNEANIRLHRYPGVVALLGKPDTTLSAFKNAKGESTHYEAFYKSGGEVVLKCRYQKEPPQEVTHIWVMHNRETNRFFDRYPNLDRSVLNYFNTPIPSITKLLPPQNTAPTTVYDLTSKSGSNGVYHIFRHNINKYYKMATKITFATVDHPEDYCDRIIFIPNY